jgi:hypothetical protein
MMMMMMMMMMMTMMMGNLDIMQVHHHTHVVGPPWARTRAHRCRCLTSR